MALQERTFVEGDWGRMQIAAAMHGGGHSATTYCGPALGPAATLGHWNLDPLFIAAIAGAAYAYWRHRATDERSDRSAGALLAAALFLYVTPFCAAGSSLFLVRVVHHLALALVLAPLLAQVATAFLARLPGGVTGWTLGATVAMWAWHAPPIYGWAATDTLGYWCMQLSILGTATLFWDRVMRCPRPLAVAALLAAMVAMGALGAIITLMPEPLYAPHFETTGAWGLSAIEDQQIAGLLMWAPASAAYLVAALFAVRRMTAPGAGA